MSDLKGLEDAWLSPEGEIHPVGYMGHDAYTYELGMMYTTMTRIGWIRLSVCGRDTGPMTQAQLDVIFDWHVANEARFEAQEYQVTS